MGRQRGSQTGRCQGCNHHERARLERLLAAGASIKGTARKFEINYHALRRHWINHVSPEARATYIAGTGATKDQLEEIVADESLALIDDKFHQRDIRRTGSTRLFGPRRNCWSSRSTDTTCLNFIAGRLQRWRHRAV